MDQEKLEEKVIDLFESQGFQCSMDRYNLSVDMGKEEKNFKVFSTEKYVEEDVIREDDGDTKIFLDEGFGELKEKLGSPVSVIKEQEDQERELPSYELIGEIAVINELNMDEQRAIENILEHHPSVKTILLKKDALSGEFRVGDYEKIYGSETETIHKEFGCQFKVDPTEVYYSERFSTERKRVMDKIEEDEDILVMFAGVGPFAILAADLAEPNSVYAVEKNPKAAAYLAENVSLNGLNDSVSYFEGDVRKVLPDLDIMFDRIIMPLPGKSLEFLDLVIGACKQDAIVHLYVFASSKEVIKDRLSDYDSFELVDIGDAGEKSPEVKRYRADLLFTLG